MIDEIVDLILKEARTRKGNDLVTNIHNVTLQVTLKVIQILDQTRQEERRQRHYESETRNPSEHP